MTKILICGDSGIGTSMAMRLSEHKDIAMVDDFIESFTINSRHYLDAECEIVEDKHSPSEQTWKSPFKYHK